MEKRKMAGKFVPLPEQVIQKLKTGHFSCCRVYLSLLSDFPIEEDWDIQGEWVQGRVVAKKARILEQSLVKPGTFYRQSWPDLEAMELVKEEKQDTILLPFLKKKMDISISVADLRDIKDMESRLSRIEAEISKLPQSEATLPQSEATLPQSEATLASTSINSIREEEINTDDDEGKKVDDAKSQEKLVDKMSPEAERKIWLLSRIDNLWPGRGYKISDEGYITEMDKYSKAALEEAFAAARASKVNRGNFDWLLNRLENPEIFVEGKRPKKLRRKSAQKPKRDEDQGTIHADWIDSEDLYRKAKR